MKKIVFFSLEAGTVGGIGRVNDTLAQALSAQGVEVHSLFLRVAENALPREGDEALRARPWRFPQGREIRAALKEKKPLRALSLGISRLWEAFLYRVDRNRARRRLRALCPDAVVTSHYLLPDAVPPELLSRTVHHVHTSYTETMRIPACERVLRRFNGKISFLWLSRAICKRAEAEGFLSSAYLYNPLHSMPPRRSEAEKSRKVVILARFSEEKRLPLAVSLLKRAMDALPDPLAFTVEIYGFGPEEEVLKREISSDGRFVLMGPTSDPYAALADARFTVNTSLFEGFSLSILEAAAAGVPTLSFVFGEAAEEEILHGKTGLLVPMDDNEAFLSQLCALFCRDDLVKRLSQGAAEFAAGFEKDKIAAEFFALLSRLPLDKREKEV